MTLKGENKNKGLVTAVSLFHYAGITVIHHLIGFNPNQWTHWTSLPKILSMYSAGFFLKIKHW